MRASLVIGSELRSPCGIELADVCDRGRVLDRRGGRWRHSEAASPAASSTWRSTPTPACLPVRVRERLLGPGRDLGAIGGQRAVARAR